MTRDLVRDLNENWVSWLQFTAEHAPGGESRTFGAIRCSSVGVAMPLFNQAFVFDEPGADELAAAVDWLVAHDLPCWVTAPDAVADSITNTNTSVALGSPVWTTPGMVFAPLSGLPVGAGGDVEIVRVTEAEQLTDLAVVAAEAFGAPMEMATLLAPPTSLADDRCSWFVGYLDGDPAVCGQLLRTGDVAGVYTIGVREKFRRRGLGAAVTATVLAAGRAAGCTVGVLQASALGRPVYERMGFETVTQYQSFSPSG